MFDLQTVKLMHRHGGERFPMEERSSHDPAADDPERGWLHGGRIFRCTRCDEEVTVLPPGQGVPDETPA
jgi:hypothetical protein